MEKATNSRLWATIKKRKAGACRFTKHNNNTPTYNKNMRTYDTRTYDYDTRKYDMRNYDMRNYDTRTYNNDTRNYDTRTYDNDTRMYNMHVYTQVHGRRHPGWHAH